MLSQFCSRYPQASFTSELLQIDHGKYIVRVSIVLEGKTLTALAGADTVEAAEDMARLRAIALISPDSDSSPLAPQPPAPEKPPLGAVMAPKTPAKTRGEKPKEIPSYPPLTLVSPVSAEAEVEQTPPPPVPPEPSSLPNLTLEPPAAEPQPEPQPEPVSVAAEMDFNQIMAQIDVEMKRLKWTKEQGRDYLRSTYGKTSRIQLNDEEIFEFLTYLKTQ